MEIMSIVASGIGLGFLYAVNKDWELGYISRGDAIDIPKALEDAGRLRKQGAFIAARTLESICRDYARPETPLSKSLKEYWTRLNDPQNSIIDKLVLEATEFPTFRGIYRSLRSSPATV